MSLILFKIVIKLIKNKPSSIYFSNANNILKKPTKILARAIFIFFFSFLYFQFFHIEHVLWTYMR